MSRMMVLALLGASLIPLRSLHTAAQTVESITAQKDRCLRKLEKVERNLDNVSAGIERIKRLRMVSSEGELSRIDAFIEKTGNKSEYINNRIERTRNQLDKIESDLQGVRTGDLCAKCVGETIDLFCRQIESIDEENTGLAGAISEFERSLRQGVSAGELLKRTDQAIAAAGAGDARYKGAKALQEKARHAIAVNDIDAAMTFALAASDSVAAIAPPEGRDCRLDAEIARASGRIEEARRAVGGDTGKAAAVLEKAVTHLEKGKSLCSAGRANEARTELSIAEKFASASMGCAVRKE